jgi:hypothetical protein
MSSKNQTFSFADESKSEVKQPRKDPAQQLLDFLQRWKKPVIRMNDILVYGPRPTFRKRESAIGPVETLVRHGWLQPLKTRRPNMMLWQIIRHPTVHPVIEP